ncbi:MAG: ATP-binding cassette domain-containing protein [Acidimicrobiia bacterium]|nr:ATP-binding cassette domain-containing protein [Acidimicrobiia bacterium]
MLIVEDLHSFYSTAEILRGVNLEVQDGECVVMLGRNGMGKTSLVRSIAGTAPPAIASGGVSWNEEHLESLSSHEVARRGIGLVPQGRHIFGSLTVEENLTVAKRNGDDPGWDLDRVYGFFGRLAERRTQLGSSLSGGEQQMLAIGRALMTNPELLLMDEPSEGLAPQVVGQVREVVEELKRENLSIFLVEQNLGFALRTADRIYILGENGVIVWEGTPAELDGDDQAKRTHLGI